MREKHVTKSDLSFVQSAGPGLFLARCLQVDF